MQCLICREEFGELIKSFLHLAEKHPDEVQRRMTAVDARMAEQKNAAGEAQQ